MKRESSGYSSQISWIFIAYEAQISQILGAYEAQISLIFANPLDNRGLRRANLLDFRGLGIENLLDNSKSPGYSEPMKREIPRHLGPMKHDSPGYLQISWISWAQGINKRSGWGVLYHRTGLSTICTLVKTGSKILRTGKEAKFRPFVDALLGPMNRESPGYLGPMKNKSPVYLQISGTFRAYEAQIKCIFANLILIQGLGSENLLDDSKSPG